MFVDLYHCKFDEKGRLMLPIDLRKKLASHVEESITLNFNLLTNCIDILTKPDIDKIQEDLEKLNRFNLEHHDFIALSFILTKSTVIDNSGRMLIAPELKVAANLGKEVVVKGHLGHFAIWNKEAYEEFARKGKERYIALAQSIMGNLNK